MNETNWTAIGTGIAMAFIAFMQVWQNWRSKQQEIKQDAIEVKTDKTAETMKEIHVAVNSKETITAKKIEEQTELIKTLSNTIKTLEERFRGIELAKAVADAKAPVIQTPPAAQV